MSDTTTAPAPRAYLDYAASAPVRPEVAEQVAADLRDCAAGWANPNALHSSARVASARLAEARARLAAAVGADPHEVLFTSGGTEASALFLSGRVLASRAAGGSGRLVISPIEHPAVADTARATVTYGGSVTVLPVDAAGRVDPAVAAAAVLTSGEGNEAAPAAALSIMAANNETGVIQDLAAIVAAVREAAGAERRTDPAWVWVHSDAVAAVGKMPLDMHALDLDALSLTGHKLGAPVGTGALLLRRECSLMTPTGGGRQERGLRSGTQDVIGARALALAVALAVEEQEAESRRLAALREELISGACALPGVHATLPPGTAHLDSTAHLWCEEVDIEALLMSLDMQGVDASSGSACHAGVAQPSSVLLAMGFSEQQARSTLRLTLGLASSGEDVRRFLTALPAALEVARKAWGVQAATRHRI